MAKPKVKLNKAGFNELRKSPEMVRMLEQFGDRVIAEATRMGRRSSLRYNPAYNRSTKIGSTRARVTVRAVGKAGGAINVGRRRGGRGTTEGRLDLLKALRRVG